MTTELVSRSYPSRKDGPPFLRTTDPCYQEFKPTCGLSGPLELFYDY